MKMPARREFFAKLGAIGGLFALAAPAQAQTSAQRRFIKTDFSQSHAYSQAVVTQGGRTVWLAGQTSPPTDASGKSFAGDFDGQVRALFAGLSQTLEEAGGKLSDIVTMTVFMVDDRFDLRFLELRKEIFKDNFPASALINIHSLVPPYRPAPHRRAPSCFAADLARCGQKFKERQSTDGKLVGAKVAR